MFDIKQRMFGYEQRKHPFTVDSRQLCTRWVQKAVRPLGSKKPLEGQEAPCMVLHAAPAAVAETSGAPREWWRVPWEGEGACA
eukprot:1161636-Pelagomonas_calceolata.AAC.2